jgi:hypothetical protein
MKAHPRNVIVAGSPGAWTNVVAHLLANKGWAITWPNQNLEVPEARFFLEHNAQNIEIHRIHQIICREHQTIPFSDRLPHFYAKVYPGPAEYLAQFPDQPVVLSSISLPPFLDLWVGASNVVINIQATEAEDLEGLRRIASLASDPVYLQSVCKTHQTRYNRHLQLFPKVFTMSNAEVKDKRFDRLSQFLNSAF